MKFFLPLLLLFSFTVKANQYDGALSAAVLGGAVAGIASGTQYSIYRSLIATELEGWSDKSTGSTIKLESQCNVQAEMHLVGDHRYNFLLLGLSNSTDNTFIVQPKDVEFVFNGETTRFPGWTAEPSDMILKPAWWQLNYIPFPSKEEFANYDTLEVRIPLMTPNEGTCVLKAKFTKQKKVMKEEVSYTIMDFHFEGGPSLTQNGPMKYLGKPSSMFGIGLNIFPHPNHGMGYYLLTEDSFKDSKNTKVQSKFEKGAKYSARTRFFGINYAYRHFVNNRVTLNYEPGFGLHTIYDANRKDKNESQKEIANSLAIVQKFMINAYYARMATPVYKTFDFTAGIGLVHTWVPSDKIASQNLNGDRFGALLRVGMGF